MRHRVLLRSVQRRLAPGEEVQLAAFMWSRHRRMLEFVAVSFLALLLVATVSGFETWWARIGIALAGAAIAANATTDYRILARTTEGLVLLQSSRIRQYATELLERLDPESTPLQRLGGTLVASEWSIGTRHYTVAKSSESSMTQISWPGAT